ncbi:MAG: hypothetical protein NC038_07095 [Paludibacter sp.]|nr:hypothetical protein [Bacteroidales bacterium]MCM1069664.1 hypothetical protein [Prevotella sp.]MCM1354310.1 hypothetical protein [Bacteroides sp.]MCM1443151.1 hypothetical protein [Muribaculum sp.]MCM1482386.1 hypothetical protein [Paludibacter sp.]
MLEILKYTLPALIVLLASWLATSKQMKNEDARRNFELRKNAQNAISPIRLRGYERLTLLLERMEPEHLLLSTDLSGMTCRTLQQQLLQTLRLEFEHNISQQIYVSDEVWTAIVLAKEEMIRFVNTCSGQFNPDDAALPLGQLMITGYAMNGETPTQRALSLLKEEARRML